MQVLIFSQFMQTIAWLKAEFKKKGINYRFISGDMPMKKRAQAIEAFQKVRANIRKPTKARINSENLHALR